MLREYSALQQSTDSDSATCQADRIYPDHSRSAASKHAREVRDRNIEAQKRFYQRRQRPTRVS